MAGLLELFNAFLPMAKEANVTDGKLTTKSQFSSGGLLAILLFVALGVGVGCLF